MDDFISTLDICSDLYAVIAYILLHDTLFLAAACISEYLNRYDVGYGEGCDVGYDVGYGVGYGVGYDVGYDVGYGVGYDVGYCSSWIFCTIYVCIPNVSLVVETASPLHACTVTVPCAHLLFSPLKSFSTSIVSPFHTL